MELTIQYFASVRETMGMDSEQLRLPDEVTTVAALMHWLAERHAAFASLADSGNPLLVAVNQTVADADASLSDKDEVAFFPPMTGG